MDVTLSGRCDPVKDFEMGRLCCLTWVGPITTVLLGGRQEESVLRGDVMMEPRDRRKRSEDATLLELQIEEGNMSGGGRWCLEAGKAPLEPPEGTSPADMLTSAP